MFSLTVSTDTFPRCQKHAEALFRSYLTEQSVLHKKGITKNILHFHREECCSILGLEHESSLYRY